MERLQFEVTLKARVSISKDRVSVNEISRDVLEFCLESGRGVIKEIIESYQKEVINSICDGQEIHEHGENCKGENGYYRDGKRWRKIETDVGKVCFKGQRIRCKRCNKVTIPILKKIGIEKQQRTTGTVIEGSFKVVEDLSYRKAAKQIEEIKGEKSSKSNIWRWVKGGEFKELLEGEEWSSDKPIVMVDGTGIKIQGKEEREKGEEGKGEIRIAIGINEGRVLPIGAWINEGWDKVGKGVADSLEDKASKAVVISDGEAGIDKNVLPNNYHQRCLWHVVRDLNYMLWKDKEEIYCRKSIQEEVAGYVNIKFSDAKKVCRRERKKIRRKLKRAKKSVNELMEVMKSCELTNAVTYLENAFSGLFTYVKLMLDFGWAIPTTINKIERTFREINRRFKRLGARWSKKGGRNLLTIILKRMFDKEGWDNYWNEKLDLNGNFLIAITSIKCEPLPT